MLINFACRHDRANPPKETLRCEEKGLRKKIKNAWWCSLSVEDWIATIKDVMIKGQCIGEQPESNLGNKLWQNCSLVSCFFFWSRLTVIWSSLLPNPAYSFVLNSAVSLGGALRDIWKEAQSINLWWILHPFMVSVQRDCPYRNARVRNDLAAAKWIWKSFFFSLSLHRTPSPSEHSSAGSYHVGFGAGLWWNSLLSRRDPLNCGTL